MVTAKVSEIGRRKQRITLIGDLAEGFREAIDAARISWPSDRYAQDPVGFCLEILGFKPWTRQAEFLEAVRDNRWTSVRSGHKVGKSRGLAAIALWWFCTFDDARVILANATGRQLEAINWNEVRKLHRQSGTCWACREAARESKQRAPRPCEHSQIIDGMPLAKSAGGLLVDDRMIVGVTSKNTEGAAGFSSPHLLVIVDEASSLDEQLNQAFQGNVASKGSKGIFAGNPTKQAGPFFDSHHRNAQLYRTMEISSVEAAAEGVPGLASFEFCDMIEGQDERGKESPFYMIRVLGKFPPKSETAIYAIAEIMAAQDSDRYEVAETPGPLLIGVDAAGEGGQGDESAISGARGFRVLEQRTGRGWSPDRHVAEVLDLVKVHGANDKRKAIVGVDADGVGAKVAALLEVAATTRQACDQIEVVRVYLGQNARNQIEFDQVGDEAHDLLSRWIRRGLCFPPSPKLEQEAQIQEWIMVSRKRFDRRIDVRSATRKRDVRMVLHRSPDRLDSLRVLAWAAYMRGVFPLQLDGAPEPDAIPIQKSKAEQLDDLIVSRGDGMDPYREFGR